MSDSTVYEIEFAIAAADFVSLLDAHGTEIGLPRLNIVIDPEQYGVKVWQGESNAPVRVTFRRRREDEADA